MTSSIRQDTNECDRYGVCSQGCVNTVGSYYCTCAKNFVLKRDNKTCASLGVEPLLVYSTQKRIKTIGIHSRVAQMVQKTKQAIGVTFDGQDFYWTEIAEGREAIVRYKPSMKRKEGILTAGLEQPEDLAVDWLTGNIYFTDSSRSHVAVCTNTGYFCTQLVYHEAMERPRAIVLHPADSLMFWTDWGKIPHIGAAYMDGSAPKVLIDGVVWPNGLALDWPNGRIYWTDAKGSTIESATISGKDRRVVLRDIARHPFSLAIMENRIYWSDWDTLGIESVDKFTGKNHETLVQGEQIFGKLTR